MSFDVKVIADSRNGINGKRIITLQLKYPRFIHAEFMTHRALSRNASSSRAIPVPRMIQATKTDPAFFVHIGKNQPGMQANEEVSQEAKELFKEEWEELCKLVCEYVERWSEDGIHKQVANRALEPWQHMQVVCTATEWDNFFELRRHKDAQPEIKVLADLIYEAMQGSSPIERPIGNVFLEPEAWHLPYILDEERKSIAPLELVKLSTARCARVSYFLHDGAEPNMEKDLELYERLVVSKPVHASPCEHQAYTVFDKEGISRNFRGWGQYRAYLGV